MTDDTTPEKPTRYAQFNVTLDRFVGPVRDSKAKAKADAEDQPEGHKVETRAV